MPYVTVDLPPIKTFTSSGGAAVTNGIGRLDDASSITLFFTSSFSGTSSAGILQVSQFDPFDSPIPPLGTALSTAWYNFSTGTALSTVSALTINNVSFKGLRVSGFTATSSAAGEIIAYATKQISV